MAKDPVLPLYYNDFDGATRTWKDEEVGAYIRLLIEQCRNGHIENTPFSLNRISDTALKNWPKIGPKFAETSPGKFQNTVLVEVLKKRKIHSEMQTERIKNRYRNSTEPSTKLPTKNLPEEKEKENEKEKELEGEKEIIYPWDSETFKSAWSVWEQYRKQQHKFTYKPIGLQGCLAELWGLSEGDEGVAIKIINQSIAKSWKGFFELKENGSGKKLKTDADQRNESTSNLANLAREIVANHRAASGDNSAGS